MAINRTQQGVTKVARRRSQKRLTPESRRVHPVQRQAVVLPEYATLQIARDDQAMPLPSGVGAGALTARVPDGTPLSVARYAAAGTSLEATPWLLTTSDERLLVGTTTPETLAHHTMTAPSNVVPLVLMQSTTGVNNRSPLLYLLRRSTGDMVDHFGVGLSFYLADTAGVDNHVGLVVVKRQGADNSGRLQLLTANAGVLDSNTAPGDLAVDPQGNVSLNLDVFASGGQRVFALGSGVAPSGGPADGVQLWCADQGPGQASLHVRTENGTSHVLGHASGINTLCVGTLGSGEAYRRFNVSGPQLFVGQSSVQERPQALLTPSFVEATDATRQSRLTLSVHDATSAREFLRGETSGGAARLGFFGVAAVARQSVPAAATDAATTQTLANSLRTALVNLGLCI